MSLKEILALFALIGSGYVGLEKLIATTPTYFSAAIFMSTLIAATVFARRKKFFN